MAVFDDSVSIVLVLMFYRESGMRTLIRRHAAHRALLNHRDSHGVADGDLHEVGPVARTSSVEIGF